MQATCPHCGAKAVIRTSIQLSKLIKTAYCQCQNVVCGHTFKAFLEVVETISPSAIPDPEVATVLQRSQRAIELEQRARDNSSTEPASAEFG
ncbi:MAG: transcriptional regulator [Rhodocyclaceae bacterium]|nr:transcriptional regulator [Rhodocyclaceae bacterium]